MIFYGLAIMLSHLKIEMEMVPGVSMPLSFGMTLTVMGYGTVASTSVIGIMMGCGI